MAKLVKKKKKKQKVKPEEALLLGIDPSLNGSGFILSVGEEIVDYKFFTQVKRIAQDSKGRGIHNNSSGPERMKIIEEFVFDYMGKINNEYGKYPDYAAIENYSFGSKGNSIFQIGGLGELYRLRLYDFGIPYREYEPPKVKKYATGSGNAEKSQMVLACYKEGFDVGPYGKSGEDLADAYWINKMLFTELKLHENSSYANEILKYRSAAFTEVTKSFPIPIINRPFIGKRG